MCTGIYALSFDSYNLNYIGQSLNIEKRYSSHICTLKKSKGNTKLQSAFNIYGVPELVIIEECNPKDLDVNEKYWINEFDSVNTGCNITIGGAGGSGCCAGPSIYSEEDIIEVLYLLIDTTLSYKEIEKRCNVKYGTIRDIASLSQHKWLEDCLPEQYTKLKNLKGHIRNTPGPLNKYTNTKLINPDGVIISIGNETLISFSTKYGIYAEKLSKLIRGRVLNYRGWRLYK